MFVTENIPALFKKGTLKLIASDEGGTRRVAEAMCLVEPFPAGLAHELGEDIAGHLFDDDGALRTELEAIDLRIRAGLQSVTVRHHEDLEPCALLAPVSIKDVSVKRIEDEKAGRAWLQLSFVLVFSLEEKAARNFVLDEFGKPLLWSFRSMQGELLSKAALAETASRMVGGGIDSVTISTPGHEGVTLTKDDARRLQGTAKKLRADAAKAH